MQFVAAQEISIDLIKNIDDDSSLEAYTNEDLQFSTSNGESSSTQLFIELKTSGNFDNEGDIFSLIAKVTNIGDVPAFFVIVELNNIPNDWEVYPESKTKFILIIYPGQTKTAEFILKKGPTDSTVFATAEAINADKVSSELIPIPVFWVTITILSITMAGLAVYYHKKK